MYDHSFVQWVLIFYLYCVLGWVFESTVVSVQQKRLVNRGFLHGPMLPIYGFGAVIMLHVALPLAGRPAAIFCAGMVVATAFEYGVGVLMETLFKVRYWDYSEHRFQFQGRICLQSSLAWGALSLVLPQLHRPVAWLVGRLSPAAAAVVAGAVSAYFVGDVILSTRTALSLAKLFDELETLRREADARRAQLAAHAVGVRAQLTAAAQEQRDRIQTAADESRLQLYLAVQEAEERINARVAQMRRLSRRTVWGNPTLRSAKYRLAASDLRRRLRHWREAHR